MKKLKDTYRQATPAEKKFFEKELYPLQDEVFKICFDNDYMYLSGGTALARYHFRHRFSEDIDIFIKIDKNDSDDNIRLTKNAGLASRNIAGLLSRRYSVEPVVYGEYFSRFFIISGDIRLKVDFVREFNHIGDIIKLPDGVNVNNIEDAAGYKISAFEDRAEIKDVVDLFFLHKELSFAEMFEIADKKREPVKYEQLLTISQSGVTGSVLTYESIDHIELEQFLDRLKSETEIEVKKKEEIIYPQLNDCIKSYLWDFPVEYKSVNDISKPVLKRRLKTFNLPLRRTLEKVLFN